MRLRFDANLPDSRGRAILLLLTPSIAAAQSVHGHQRRSLKFIYKREKHHVADTVCRVAREHSGFWYYNAVRCSEWPVETQPLGRPNPCLHGCQLLQAYLQTSITYPRWV
nr:hypothetical protein CFP56_20501 [Quercus suber]